MSAENRPAIPVTGYGAAAAGRALIGWTGPYAPLLPRSIAITSFDVWSAAVVKPCPYSLIATCGRFGALLSGARESVVDELTRRHAAFQTSVEQSAEKRQGELARLDNQVKLLDVRVTRELAEIRQTTEEWQRTADEQHPTPVVAEARVLRAKSYQEEGNWAEAAPLWREVLADRRNPPAEPGPVLYQLGLCSRRLEQNGDEPLRTGVPLSERGLSGDVIAHALKGMSQTRWRRLL